MKIRNDHRVHVLHLIKEFSRTNADLLNLKELKKSLQEFEVTILKNLEAEILKLIPEDEAETLTNNICKSCQFSDEINDILGKVSIQTVQILLYCPS